MDLTLTTRVDGTAAVVLLDGEVDVFTAPTMRDGLAEPIRAGHHHLVLDMEKVTFLDSTGLGVLIGALKKVRAHDGSVRVVCTHERIIKIFRITGLARVFPIHPSIATALACIQADIRADIRVDTPVEADSMHADADTTPARTATPVG